MCGIALIWDKQGRLTSISIERMLASMAARGPDARNFLCQPLKNGSKVWIGHTLLRLHRKSPKQPMKEEDKPLILTYNGEIYNLDALANALQYPMPASDTELLYHYLWQKQTCNACQLPQLEGMFAFIAFDANTQSLIVGRDDYGIKPLYYYEDAYYLIFASEPQAILSTGLPISKEIDPAEVRQFLCFRAPSPGRTLFRHIHALACGYHCIQLANRSGGCMLALQSPKSKATATVRPELINEHQLIERVAFQLVESVDLQLRVGNPALWLSGGIDSSLLAVCAAKLGRQLPALTLVAYTSPQEQRKSIHTCKDEMYARRLCQLLGIEWIPVYLEKKAFFELLPDFMTCSAFPVADPAAFLTFFLARHTAQLSRAALTGTGADEWWAGYMRHWAYYYTMRAPTFFATVSAFLHKPLRSLLHRHDILRQLKKWTEAINSLPYPYWFYGWASLRLPQPLPQGLAPVCSLEEVLSFDRHYYLPQVLLTAHDSYAMAQAVELRPAYLLPRLTVLPAQLPAQYLLKRGRKWLLRAILEYLEPQLHFVGRRAKEGFGFPVGQWMRQIPEQLPGKVLKQVHAPVYEYLPYPLVQEMWRQHYHGQDDYSHELWALWLLNNFLEQYS